MISSDQHHQFQHRVRGGPGEHHRVSKTGGTPPTEAETAEPRLVDSVLCWGTSIPIDALTGDIDQEPPVGAQRQATSWQATTTTVPDAETVAPHELRFAGLDSGTALFLVMTDGGIGTVEFVVDNGAWTFYRSTHECSQLRRASTTGRTDPIYWRERPAPGDTHLRLVAHEQACTFPTATVLSDTSCT